MLLSSKPNLFIMKKVLLPVLGLLFAVTLFAQKRTVTGKVSTADGKPVQFATVTVKGVSGGKSADENGNFSIDAAPNSILVISAVGFQPMEINIGDQSDLSVTLTSQGAMSEVIVTALGIRRSDKGLGYSVAKVDPNALVQKSEPDVLKSMQGKVAGVDI